MTEYLKTVIATVVCVSLICGILPKEGAEKYVGFAVSIIVAVIVVTPFFDFLDKNQFSLSDINAEELAVNGAAYLKGEFESVIAEQISEKLKDETGLPFDVAVRVKINEDNSFTEITSVAIAPYSEQYAKAVADYMEIEQNAVVEKQ